MYIVITIIDSIKHLNDFESLFNWISLTSLAEIASILGFLLSLYVAKNVYNVNRYIFISRRLPQYINKPDTYASSILDLSNNFPDTKEEIIDEVSKCSTDFKTIIKKPQEYYEKK